MGKLGVVIENFKIVLDYFKIILQLDSFNLIFMYSLCSIVVLLWIAINLCQNSKILIDDVNYKK